MKTLVRILHYVELPIHWAARVLHTRSIFVVLRSRRTVKCVVGIAIMFMGVWVAHQVTILGQMAADVLGYGLHAYGALPLLRLAAHFIED